jgi:hypothetical protein
VITIEEFCYRHNACDEGRRWAMNNCATMQEAWDKCRPGWLIWIAIQPGVLSDRDLRLAAVQIARTVQHLMTDPRSLTALDVAERHASGRATDAELAAAMAAARDAARDAKDAASAAARDVAWAAAWDAAWDAAREKHAAIIRQFTPNFEGGAK